MASPSFSVQPKTVVSTKVVVAAVLITALFALIFYACSELVVLIVHIEFGFPDVSRDGYGEVKVPVLYRFLSSLIYALLHPVIGRGLAGLSNFLGNLLDAVFDTYEWGDWNIETKMIYGALWPIAAPIWIPLSLIGVIFGALYKVLF